MNEQEILNVFNDVLKHYFNTDVLENQKYERIEFDKKNNCLRLIVKYNDFFDIKLRPNIFDFSIGEEVYFMYENKIISGEIKEFMVNSCSVYYNVGFYKNSKRMEYERFLKDKLFRTKEELIKNLLNEN